MTTTQSANNSPRFDSITGAHWRSMFRDYRESGGVEGNVAWRQIRDAHPKPFPASGVTVAVKCALDGVASYAPARDSISK